MNYYLYGVNVPTFAGVLRAGARVRVHGTFIPLRLGCGVERAIFVIDANPA